MIHDARQATRRDAAIGRLVRTRRILKRMSQTELGERVGVTFQQIQKYENGKNRISAGRLAEIAIALETPIAWFFNETAGINDASELDELLEAAAGDPEILRAAGKLTTLTTASRKGMLDLIDEAAKFAAARRREARDPGDTGRGPAAVPALRVAAG